MDELRICPQCGKEFKPKNEGHVYCVRQCRYDFNNARKAKPENDENRVYTRLHGGVQVPDGYVLVPEKDWHRLMQMVTDLVLNQTSKKDQMSFQEARPSIPMPTPLVIDDDDMPIVQVKKSSKETNTSQNFLNSMNALLNSD